MKNGKYLVILVLLMGIGLRMKNLTMLPTDAHPMRQTDTECVAYYLAKGQAIFLLPQACLIRPTSNKNGYFMLEVPFYEGLMAAGYQVFGYRAVVARVINLMLFTGGSLGLGYVMWKWWNKKVAIMTMFIYSLVPGSIFFLGHALHPDVMAVNAMLIGLYFTWKYRENNQVFNLLFGGLVMGISVATRPFILISLPMFGYILWLKKSKVWQYLIFLVLVVGIYGLWRWWIIAQGVDMNWENWVLNGQGELLAVDNLKRLIWKNVMGEVMGKVVSLLAVLGLIIKLLKKDKWMWPLVMWLGGVVVYWMVVPDGNLTHQYYADIFIPLVAILAAVGLEEIFNRQKVIGWLVVALVIYNGVRTSNYFFGDNQRDFEIRVAEEIDQVVPANKKIIYLGHDNSVPISLAHRQGWMLGDSPTDVGPNTESVKQMEGRFDYIIEPINRADLPKEELEKIQKRYVLVKEMKDIRVYQNNN